MPLYVQIYVYMYARATTHPQTHEHSKAYKIWHKYTQAKFPHQTKKLTISFGLSLWRKRKAWNPESQTLPFNIYIHIFQAAVTSILLYGCTTWTLTKRLEKKLDGNYTRMLRAILNKSWQQHPTRHQLYGHLPPITKSIQVRWTRHAGHCWRSRDELIRDVLLWIPTHGRAKTGRPARTYIQQLCEDTGCCPEDLPRAMNDMEEWRERVRDIRAASTIWWWWWYIGSEKDAVEDLERVGSLHSVPLGRLPFQPVSTHSKD